jgi:hypothetical protein
MEQRILFTLLGILFLNLAFSQNKKAPESNLNKELIAILDTIHQEDQKYRKESQELGKKYGWDSKEMQDVWKIINVKDSINLIKVEKILAEYGWLGADVIGEQGNRTLFLVIQHSPDNKIQQKYLPMMREAVNKGNADAKSLALLEDRVALSEGEKQIYGSQLEMDYKTNLYVLSPMIDPDNIDKRRAEVGLNPIAEYLKFWDLTWDVEKFKKRMEEYDAEKNNK